MTTLRKTSPNDVSMSHDGCNEVQVLCDVNVRMKRWPTDYWQQSRNTEINLNRIQLSEIGKTQQEQKKERQKMKYKTQAAFCLKPRGSDFEVVCFRGLTGEAFWEVRCFDKLAKPFCCALCLCPLLMAPQHKAIWKHNKLRHLLSSKVHPSELWLIILFLFSPSPLHIFPCESCASLSTAYSNSCSI